MPQDEIPQDIKNQFSLVVAIRDQIMAYIRDHEEDIKRMSNDGPSRVEDLKTISVLCEFALSEMYLNAEMKLEP